MKIALVTPLHNEINSIELLFKSIENQSIRVNTWVIVENGSADGSKELLARMEKPSNVTNLIILNEDRFGKSHALGNKYSSIIKFGFDFIIEDVGKHDYLGILDSDCFPEARYYEKLITFLEKSENVGITSGRIYLANGELDQANPNWVRGGIRVWKWECFVNSGYLVAPSADAISSALAELKGWKSKVCVQARVDSREVGAKVNYEYYGYATYYRGCSLAYVITKSAYLFLKSPAKSYRFFKGFMKSYLANEERIDNQEVINYFNKSLWNRLFKS